MKGKTVLISGANGYIALHLAKFLTQQNYKVVRATRDTSGDIKLDFSQPSDVVSQVVSGIDVMLHTVSPNESLYKTDRYCALSENASGIHAALDFCVKNKINNFIYLSSFHVFGKSEGRLTEDTAVAPCNDYGLAHYTAEQTVQLFDRTNQVNAWIVRPSNLFGVPVNCDRFNRWNLVPFLFCKEAIQSKLITLLTPGNQLRNFVGVTDLCRRLIWIIEQSPEERIIHAYGNETLSIYQYAQLVQKVALNKFQLPVQISRPNGSDQVLNFDFTSLYNNPAHTPNEKLESFVEEMIKELI